MFQKELTLIKQIHYWFQPYSNYSKLTIHYYDYCLFLIIMIMIMIMIMIIIVIFYHYYDYKCILWGFNRNETVNRLKNSVL